MTVSCNTTYKENRADSSSLPLPRLVQEFTKLSVGEPFIARTVGVEELKHKWPASYNARTPRKERSSYNGLQHTELSKEEHDESTFGVATLVTAGKWRTNLDFPEDWPPTTTI